MKRKTGTAGLINSYGDDMQPGDVVHSARTTAPAGYLIANGAAVSRTVYGNLFNALGTLYGEGDGATTFNVPDLRGEFIRGADQGRGVDAGRTVGNNQLDALQGHYHDVKTSSSDGYFYNGSSGGTNNVPLGGATSADKYVAKAAITDGVNGTPRTAGETRPRNIALLPLIKY